TRTRCARPFSTWHQFTTGTGSPPFGWRLNHVSTSRSSANIFRRLERELGQELFDRSGGPVRMTSAGTAVLPLARAALAAVHEIAGIAEQLKGVLRGRVAVGMMTSCPPDVITGALAAFHDEHPGVEISLAEASSADLITGLRHGAIDLAHRDV